MGYDRISHNQRKDNMNTEKTFYITYFAKTHNGIKLDKGKHITRLAKHDENSRYGTNKKGQHYYVHYDIDAHNYRCATGSWKVRSA